MQKDALDRFYTKDIVVDCCIDYLCSSVGVLFSDFDCIVEPSAGAGAFLNKLPKGTLAFDISPAEGTQNIVKKDWLDVLASDLSETESVQSLLIIGNPPFGMRGALAKQFITHAIALGANTIAFILPEVFSKYRNQKCFPDNWRLVGVCHLPQNSFVLDGESYHVPCAFFVWTCNGAYMTGIDMRDKLYPMPVEFEYLNRGDSDADFVLNGNNGKVKDIGSVTNSKAEHYIKVNSEYDVESIRDKFEHLHFDFKSSANGGVAWLNQNDINKAWYVAYGM